MAKITDLVKTYRLLSDPNAPDWNVKFIGGIAIAAIVVAAGAGALLWTWSASDVPANAPAASVQDRADPAEDPCALPDDTTDASTLPAECIEPSPTVLP